MYLDHLEKGEAAGPQRRSAPVINFSFNQPADDTIDITSEEDIQDIEEEDEE
jgi:hypothetical protein